MDAHALLQTGFRFALALRPVREDAEDLVQEAWLRLHNKKGGVRDQAQLFTTIRNLYIDQYRREKLLHFEPLDKVAEIAASPQPLADSISFDELEKPLAKLRLEEREALFLNVVAGYTAQEIADFTQRSRGGILSLLHRAKRKLHKSLLAQQAMPIPLSTAGVVKND